MRTNSMTFNLNLLRNMTRILHAEKGSSTAPKEVDEQLQIRPDNRAVTVAMSIEARQRQTRLYLKNKMDKKEKIRKRKNKKHN